MQSSCSTKMPKPYDFSQNNKCMYTASGDLVCQVKDGTSAILEGSVGGLNPRGQLQPEVDMSPAAAKKKPIVEKFSDCAACQLTGPH